MKSPVVELSECVLCEICIQLSPSVFSLNELSYINVADLSEYPVIEVDEAIKNCPSDCIAWSD